MDGCAPPRSDRVARPWLAERGRCQPHKMAARLLHQPCAMAARSLRPPCGIVPEALRQPCAMVPRAPRDDCASATRAPRASRAHPARIAARISAERDICANSYGFLPPRPFQHAALAFERAGCARRSRSMRAALAFDARSARVRCAQRSCAIRVSFMRGARTYHPQRPRGAGNALAESGHGTCALGWRGARDPP